MKEMKKQFVYRNEVMLAAARILCEVFMMYKTVIITKRPSWKDPFMDNFSLKLKGVIKKYAGFQPRKELKKYTQLLNEKIDFVISDLRNLRTQIEADFGNDAKEMLLIKESLGLTRKTPL